MSLRNRSRDGSRGRPSSRDCSRFSISSDPTALADARLKHVSNQVDHFSKWADNERSQYEQVQRSRPSTSSSVGRARTGAPGQTRAGCGVRVVEQARHHAGSVQPHLQTGADLGWLAGAGTRTEVVARTRSTSPTATAKARGHPRDSQSPLPEFGTASRPDTADNMFADHKDGKWIASVTPPPLTPNTRLTLGTHLCRARRHTSRCESHRAPFIPAVCRFTGRGAREAGAGFALARIFAWPGAPLHLSGQHDANAARGSVKLGRPGEPAAGGALNWAGCVPRKAEGHLGDANLAQ